MELYKKHRPERLRDVVGNKETVKSLRNMLKNDTLPHTIMFHGPSGCGKTTMARILRKELNCKEMDFSEQNASDFRGIDSVRTIINNMNLQPVGDCRVWLLDEAHQMTSAAQHAMLKMLEDTPDHVYFFICTTEPNKLLKTIRTRCTKMQVDLLGDRELERLVRRVARKEDLNLEQTVIDELVFACEGSPRELLVGLDAIANLDEDEREEAAKASVSDRQEAIELCRALINFKSWSTVAEIIKDLDCEPESARRAALGYAQSCLLSSNKQETQERAFLIIDCLHEPLYDIGKPGLTMACYEIVCMA